MRCGQDPHRAADHPSLGRTRIVIAARVQIRLTTDVSLGVERRKTITEADAAIEIVQIWLLEMATTTP